jgi:spore coat protein U-like protein
MRRPFRYLFLMTGFVLASTLVPSTPALPAPGCALVSRTPPIFSTYLSLTTNLTAADPSTTAGVITLSCSPNNGPGTISISTNTTKMANGANNLNYTVYQIGSTTTQWLTTTAGAATVHFNAGIPGGQNVPAGTYTDAITTFTFTYPTGKTPVNFIVALNTVATVGQECVFGSSTGTVNFATPYDPIVTNSATGADETLTWAAQYRCTTNDSTYKWSFASTNASGTQMRMKSAAATFLNYYVHDSSGTNFPSGGTSQAATGESSGLGGGTGTTNQLTYNFTFGIPKGQNLAAGSFSDSNLVTITP